VHRHFAHQSRRHRVRALRRGRSQDGRELPQARGRRLLRRRRLPPDHQGLHDPGRGSAGDRHRRPRLHLRGRDQPAQDRARGAGHGQRGTKHERLAVLHRHHGRRALARRQAHRVRAGGERHGRRRRARGAAHRRARPAEGPRPDRTRRAWL
ncbi:MAG: Peptidyl-prolyl cis-trans isomerase, partial [uncultured Solirubrobacteraceae bacterium]